MSTKKRAISISDLRLFQLEPNLTAILPGRCQARCPFCIEPYSPKQASAEEWLSSLQRLVHDELPDNFKVLSLSGGEPLLSPILPDLLRWLARIKESGRLKRIILTTNGLAPAMQEHLHLLGPALTHVNISRHSENDSINTKVFKTDKVPTISELRDLVSKLNRKGLPVNFNCVYSREHAFGQRITGTSRAVLRAMAKNYINFARNLGATSVVFRLDHRDERLDVETRLEEAFPDYVAMHQSSCASCRVVGKYIRGMPVNFKRAVHEPVTMHYESELYELVFHSNGNLYLDWSRLRPVKRPLARMVPSPDWQRYIPKRVGVPTNPAPECDELQATCNLWMGAEA